MCLYQILDARVFDHAINRISGPCTVLLGNRAIYLFRYHKAIRAINPFGKYMFMDKQGRRIRANRFNHWLHRTCKKVGIPERSTHKIRKTYASILLSNRVEDRLITAQMGHTDIATTRGSYYFNRNSEDKNKGIISSAINFYHEYSWFYAFSGVSSSKSVLLQSVTVVTNRDGEEKMQRKTLHAQFQTLHTGLFYAEEET